MTWCWEAGLLSCLFLALVCLSLFFVGKTWFSTSHRLSTQIHCKEEERGEPLLYREKYFKALKVWNRNKKEKGVLKEANWAYRWNWQWNYQWGSLQWSKKEGGLARDRSMRRWVGASPCGLDLVAWGWRCWWWNYKRESKESICTSLWNSG